MATRATVNQLVQLGVEATRGTTVPANRLIEAFTWTFGSKPVTKQFTATGRKHPGASELLYEQSAGKIGGEGCYQSFVYPFSSLWGAPTPALHGTALVASDWVYIPALSGAYSPKTYTLQNGDVNDAEQYGYGLFTGLGYSFTRKTEVQVSGDWISQTFTDGQTLTAAPTPIARQPMTGAHANVFLDPTSANIGNTQILTDLLKFDWKASNLYGPFYPVNRANASFTNHIDLMPKYELSILFHASSAAIGYKATYLNTGVRAYMRADLVGAVIEVDQIVSVGAATAGTFTLTYKGQTTAGIAWNATAAAVASALQLLSTIGATGCVVSGTAPNWTVRMTGALATDTTAMTGSGSGLTGGAFSISTSVVNAEMKHDMALFMTDYKDLTDVDGAYGVETTWVAAEDTAWASGQSQVLTLTNLLSGL